MIEPQLWARTIADHLERRSIVGALLPDDGSGGNDRFIPRRASISYKWSNINNAVTKILFKVSAPENKAFVNVDKGSYSVITKLSTEWGNEWEDVEILIPSTNFLEAEIKETSRFHIRVTIRDQELNPGIYVRRVSIENLRQRHGTINAIRILQLNLPELVPMRPSGIDEERYYRASGLIGFFNAERTELEFKPYAILPEKSRKPAPGPKLEEAIQTGIISEQTANLFKTKGISNLYEFQAEGISKIGEWLDTGAQAAAILLTVGTAAGKTEAFLIPLLDRLVEDKQYFGVKGLFVYPTKALQADQAKRFFEFLANFNEGRDNPISIGTLNGDTEWDIESVAQLERQGQFRSPFSKCPKNGCNGKLLFAIDVDKKDLYSPPFCESCRTEFPWLRFHRTQLKKYPPNILLTIPDLLQRQVSDHFAWQSQTLLGRPVHICPTCGVYIATSTASLDGRKPCECGEPLAPPVSVCPSLIVFDEAHMLKGMFGSNVALLIARIKKIANDYGHNPVMIGSSATIASPQEFGLQLFGGKIEIVKGQEGNSDAPPTRYHLFFMPVKISVLYAVGHTLTGCFVVDNDHDQENRVLIFSDSKRTVYQLESTLSEFYATESGPLVEGLNSTTRSHTGDLSTEERRKREIAFDKREIRVLLATQTLEVGVDFENLQLEIQTGATYSYNDYIQRVGRAGRKEVPALVTCILNPQYPLDYYYYEHCRELVQFSEDNLDDVPIRSDNPFLIEKQVPAALQDYLIKYEKGAKLIWYVRDAVNVLTNNKVEIEKYLTDIFNPPHAFEPDLINEAINKGYNKVLAVLRTNVNSGKNLSELLKQVIKLPIRSTDIDIPINSDDFDQHKGISLSGEIPDEDFDDYPDNSEGITEE